MKWEMSPFKGEYIVDLGTDWQVRVRKSGNHDSKWSASLSGPNVDMSKPWCRTRKEAMAFCEKALPLLQELEKL